MRIRIQPLKKLGSESVKLYKVKTDGNIAVSMTKELVELICDPSGLVPASCFDNAQVSRYCQTFQCSILVLVKYCQSIQYSCSLLSVFFNTCQVITVRLSNIVLLFLLSTVCQSNILVLCCQSALIIAR